MNKIYRFFPLASTLAATALLAISANSASAEGFFLSTELGFADADFGEAIFSNGDGIGPLGDDAVLPAGLFAGYEWDNDVFVEAGYQGYGSLAVAVLADSLDIEAFRAAVGYYLPSESKFRVFGKAGVNFWELEARESFVFNPGPEETSILDGTNLFAQAGVEYRFSDRVRAGASLSYSDFDVGSATAFNLSLKVLPWGTP